MEAVTQNAGQTAKLGEELGNSLRGGEVIGLVGELGSGKTTFVQGLARGLGVRGKITSPTFILQREHTARDRVLRLYHIDLYRLEEDVRGEFKNLGVQDLWKNPQNIVVIEWAEKIKSLLPKNTIWIKFENLGENRRRIETLYRH